MSNRQCKNSPDRFSFIHSFSSSLSSCHEKAAEALCVGRIQTHLGVACVSKFPVEFSSDFFNLLLARFHKAEIIIIVKHLVLGRNNEIRWGVEPLTLRLHVVCG